MKTHNELYNAIRERLLINELVLGTILFMSKHYMSNTPPYNSWVSMKQRCVNPKNEQYRNYGARGISFCEKWNKFSGFWEDMGKSYRNGLTIDRIDNDGNYCKENCRWSTQKEQSNNKRTNLYIHFNNERKSLTEWCEELNLPYERTKRRIHSKMSPRDAFAKEKYSTGKTRPLSKAIIDRNKIIKKRILNGELYKEIAKDYSITESMVSVIKSRY